MTRLTPGVLWFACSLAVFTLLLVVWVTVKVGGQ